MEDGLIVERGRILEHFEDYRPSLVCFRKLDQLLVGHFEDVPVERSSVGIPDCCLLTS